MSALALDERPEPPDGCTGMPWCTCWDHDRLDQWRPPTRATSLLTLASAAAADSGPPLTTTVAGVQLTQTATGWTAQGLALDLVEDSPAYWQTRLADGRTPAATTRNRLIRWLVAEGHLVAGATEKAAS